MKPIRIAIDFDGTIVKHEYPDIGAPVPSALRVIQRLQGNPRVALMLWTMRCDSAGAILGNHALPQGIDSHIPRNCLAEAMKFCEDNGLQFIHFNHDPHQKVWTGSPKLYATYYIDDAAVGCPLIVEPGQRPFVNWVAIERFFESEGILVPEAEQDHH